jgi:2-methylcitrate dehydratase PrpD
MAAALIDGQCLPAQFTDERVADAEVAAVRNRIHAIEDAAIGQDRCEVTLTLADGQMLMYRVDHATGSPDRPMTDTQLEAKFHALAGSVLTPARASRLLDVLWHVEDLGDVAEILALCRTGGGSTGLQRPARHPRGARRPAKAVIAD